MLLCNLTYKLGTTNYTLTSNRPLYGIDILINIMLNSGSLLESQLVICSEFFQAFQDQREFKILINLIIVITKIFFEMWNVSRC